MKKREKKQRLTDSHCSQILFGTHTSPSLSTDKLRVVASRAFKVAAAYFGVSLDKHSDYVVKRIELLLCDFDRVHELTLEPMIDRHIRLAPQISNLLKFLEFARDVRIHSGIDATDDGGALLVALDEMYQDAKSRISRSNIDEERCAEWKNIVLQEAVRLKKLNKDLTVRDLARRIAANQDINYTMKAESTIRKTLNQYRF